MSIVNIATEETYQDGQIIFEEGSFGEWIYVILSGTVEISKKVGGQKVIIRRLEPEEVFGELGFLGIKERTATARAIGETTLGVIDHEFVAEEFNKLSGDFRIILEAVVKRLKETLDLACKLSTRK